MSLFRTPKLQSIAAPNPDMGNRGDSERRARLGSGGSQSTLLSKAMTVSPAAKAVSTLTGIS